MVKVGSWRLLFETFDWQGVGSFTGTARVVVAKGQGKSSCVYKAG